MAPDNDHDHDHSHDHDHDHDNHLSEMVLRVKALESLLMEKGLVDPAALDAMIDAYETKIGPRNGARVVAKAWTDPAYKARLMEDATAAIAELGYSGAQGEHMVVVENTPTVHNLVVCTLCSCYPWPVLGLPPNWYKMPAYRSRAVLEPRKLLREFGLELPESVEVRVWDSSAEVRYLVLPERAAGCCCGRTETGFPPVPRARFHDEWERRSLRHRVHLTIGGCLGPCRLANVVMLLFDGRQAWFHSINSEAEAHALYDYIEELLG